MYIVLSFIIYVILSVVFGWWRYKCWQQKLLEIELDGSIVASQRRELFWVSGFAVVVSTLLIVLIKQSIEWSIWNKVETESVSKYIFEEKLKFSEPETKVKELHCLILAANKPKQEPNTNPTSASNSQSESNKNSTINCQAPDSTKGFIESIDGIEQFLKSPESLYTLYVKALFNKVPLDYYEISIDESKGMGKIYKLLHDLVTTRQQNENNDATSKKTTIPLHKEVANTVFGTVWTVIQNQENRSKLEKYLPIPKLDLFEVTPTEPASFYKEHMGKSLTIDKDGKVIEQDKGSIVVDKFMADMQFIRAYLNIYSRIFDNEVRQAQRYLGIVQFVLYVMFFVSIVMISKRFCLVYVNRNKTGQQDLASSAFKSRTLKSVDEFKSVWTELIDNVEYVPLNYFIWAIPSVGFIGTVLGISYSLGSAYLVVLAQGKQEQVAAVAEVTSKLELAFDTTLIALILNIVIMAAYSLLRSNESRILLNTINSDVKSEEAEDEGR